MGTNWIDIVIVIIYCLSMLWIGMWTAKKIKNFDDYAVGGRSVPLPILFATIAATLVGGGATIGRIEYIHKTGFVIFIALLGVCASQLFSGFYIAPKVRNAGKNVYGIGDIFSHQYGQLASVIASIIAFLFCLGLFGTQVSAMGTILEVVTGIAVWKGALIAALLTVLYTFIGGYLAVILTDSIQYVIIAIGISICGILAINAAGGFDAMMATLNNSQQFAQNMSPLSGLEVRKVVGLFFAFLLGEFCAPYFIQRYASADSAKSSGRSVIIFAVYYFFFLACTAGIGLASLVLQPNVAPRLALTTLVTHVLPVGLTGIVLAALLAAVMSSGSSFINTASVIYSRDIYSKFFNKNATQKQMIKQSRIATLALGVAAVFIAISFKSVIGLLIYVYKIWPAAILPPLLAAILLRKKGGIKPFISSYAVAPAMILGGLTSLGWMHFGEPYGIPSNLLGLAVNIVVLIVVHLATFSKKPTGIFLPEMYKGE